MYLIIDCRTAGDSHLHSAMYDFYLRHVVQDQRDEHIQHQSGRVQVRVVQVGSAGPIGVEICYQSADAQGLRHSTQAHTHTSHTYIHTYNI